MSTNDLAAAYETTWEGRRVSITWLPAPFEPPRELTTAVDGVCFTELRKIILVASDGQRWRLPGGPLGAGETLGEALARAVWQEASAQVVRSQYLGCQRIDDPEHPGGPRVTYQARFWARAEAYPFKPQAETAARNLVGTDAFLATIEWGAAPAAKLLLDQALAVENRHGSGCI